MKFLSQHEKTAICISDELNTQSFKKNIKISEFNIKKCQIWIPNRDLGFLQIIWASNSYPFKASTSSRIQFTAGTCFLAEKRLICTVCLCVISNILQITDTSTHWKMNILMNVLSGTWSVLYCTVQLMRIGSCHWRTGKENQSSISIATVNLSFVFFFCFFLQFQAPRTVN